MILTGRGAKKRGGASKSAVKKQKGMRVRSTKSGGLELAMSPKLAIKLYKSVVGKMK